MDTLHFLKADDPSLLSHLFSSDKQLTILNLCYQVPVASHGNRPQDTSFICYSNFSIVQRILKVCLLPRKKLLCWRSSFLFSFHNRSAERADNLYKYNRWDEYLCTTCTAKNINSPGTCIPSDITCGGRMHSDREDTVAKTQITQRGEIGLRVLAWALTSRTSLPIQGSDSQKLFLSSSLFYPLEQLHMDHWTQSCLWPEVLEHTPLEGKEKSSHNHATTQSVHIWSTSLEQPEKQEYHFFSNELQLMAHYSAQGRSISTCYHVPEQKETQIRESLPLNSL